MIIAGMVLSGLGYDRTTFAAAAKARPSGPADARELERFADAFFERENRRMPAALSLSWSRMGECC